ncbi:hypothetical protein BESB_070460 [Besnoitia besnoiti]|uniref:Transmembrane protein n=1 Tax=Besnoitia besnoiti TaxID=94643 RepID=A0A2A9M9L1_BESBE|nr:uncharacterized protein BESB_070460 [Besnoitia besnoiti]PFH33894.1 hypothetical protein BESB_070460 [Besnoitia besnoiti]
MQTEASVRYHCVRIRDRLAEQIVSALAKIRDPEQYQAALNAYLGAVQMARVAVLRGKEFADLTIVCPFMPTYLDENTVADEQKNLAIYAISKQTAGREILHRITRTKLAFVPVFMPIAGLAWIGTGVRSAARKLTSLFRRKTIGKLRLRQPPSRKLDGEEKLKTNVYED